LPFNALESYTVKRIEPYRPGETTVSLTYEALEESSDAQHGYQSFSDDGYENLDAAALWVKGETITPYSTVPVIYDLSQNVDLAAGDQSSTGSAWPIPADQRARHWSDASYTTRFFSPELGETSLEAPVTDL
jgi:hypothetical protein